MNDSPELDSGLLDLLIRWEEQSASGSKITPEELCRDCPERVDELRRHIEQLDRLKPFLAVSKPAPDQLPTIPGFELLNEVGRGGMGAVYRAKDLALDRIVALKVPYGKPGMTLPHKRFEREVRALAKLRHPNIVSVYAAGMSGDTPYFVMDYLAGGSLAEQIPEVALTPQQAAALIETVARAVHQAHLAGIIHRDLKPSNILLDESGQPFVSDFGVAMLLAGESLTTSADDTPDNRLSTQTRLSSSGKGVGTPAYSAPEQYDPDRFGPIGPATDIWSLGVILHELLTYRRPFSGKTWSELHDQVCSGVVTPIPGVSRRLQHIVARCLSKDPSRRFQTANQLADALIATKSRWRLAVSVLITSLALAGGYTIYLSPQSEPIWPNLPAVRLVQDRLTHGEAVDLVTPGQSPAVFDWATGAGSGRVISPKGDNFRVVNLSPIGCLVELLPSLPPGRFRIEGELLHETGNGMSWVGLYAGASHCEIPRGRQHYLTIARYSDHGSPAIESINNNTAMSNRRTHLLAQYLGDSDTNLMASEASWPNHPEGRLISAPPIGWRKISMIVDKNSIVGYQDEIRIGQMNLAQMTQTFTTAVNKYPDLQQEGWSVRPLGGVGLYVSNGSLMLRSFRITPIHFED